ncbi:hypothetical protein [Paenibacillus xylanexedens]|uniref:hypothetical protein n=1 Tax=Paenibacillus xylanexedens TaxID=528191 RepID=UPI00142DBCA7|nr:hypothetical protein [Paenibacillus xylanexedens]
MYGKIVNVDLGEDVIVEVFVSCTPDTADKELQNLAIRKLERLIGNIRFQEVSGIKV